MHHVHAHLRAYLSDVAALPGGQLAEDRGMLWSRTEIPWPMFNGAIATPELGPCDAAERAVAPLARSGLPWFMWVLPDTPASVVDAAAQAGAIEFDHQAPWLEARIADLEDPELGEQAWTMPGELCGWRDLPWRQWIAFADGEPAAVTLLYCGGGVAGLFGVGTKKAMRRRGLGRLVTLLPLKESGEQLAGFFSTPDGAHLYRSLGFEPQGWVSRWLGGLPDPEALKHARGATGTDAS